MVSWPTTSPFFIVRDDAIENVQVGAADRAGRDLDDGVARMFDFRIGNAVAAHVAFAVPDQCFQVVTPNQCVGDQFPIAGEVPGAAGRARDSRGEELCSGHYAFARRFARSLAPAILARRLPFTLVDQGWKFALVLDRLDRLRLWGPGRDESGREPILFSDGEFGRAPSAPCRGLPAGLHSARSGMPAHESFAQHPLDRP